VSSGTGAGVTKVTVEFVIALGWGNGTRESFGGWAEMSLLTLLVIWVISVTSLSDNAAKLQRAWDCCCMLSSRLWDCWRMQRSMGAWQSIWGQGASSFANGILFQVEEVSGVEMLSEHCTLSWTMQF